jgi:hypothetical protein
MVVGFDGPPPLDLDDILGYVGFDPYASGKNLWGRIETYMVETKVKDVEIRIVKYLDENIESEYLSLVFVNPMPVERKDDQLFVAKRLKQVSGITAELIRRLRLTPYNTFEQFDVENLSAIVFKDAAAELDKELIRGNRRALSTTNHPPKE